MPNPRARLKLIVQRACDEFAQATGERVVRIEVEPSGIKVWTATLPVPSVRPGVDTPPESQGEPQAGG